MERHHAVEVPFTPSALAALDDGERPATATDAVAPSGEFAGVELEAVRPHLLRIASKTLTDQQLAIFTRWLGNTPVGVIAKELGITQQVVSKALFGQRAPGAATSKGGILEKLRGALVLDAEYLASIGAAKAGHGALSEKDFICAWFAPITANTLSQLPAFLVLLMIHCIVDVKKRTSFADLHERLHPSVVTPAIPMLKLHGYIRTDGRYIELVRTPLEARK